MIARGLICKFANLSTNLNTQKYKFKWRVEAPTVNSRLLWYFMLFCNNCNVETESCSCILKLLWSNFNLLSVLLAICPNLAQISTKHKKIVGDQVTWTSNILSLLEFIRTYLKTNNSITSSWHFLLFYWFHHILWDINDFATLYRLVFDGKC